MQKMQEQRSGKPDELRQVQVLQMHNDVDSLYTKKKILVEEMTLSLVPLNLAFKRGSETFLAELKDNKHARGSKVMMTPGSVPWSRKFAKRRLKRWVGQEAEQNKRHYHQKR